MRRFRLCLAAVHGVADETEAVAKIRNRHVDALAVRSGEYEPCRIVLAADVERVYLDTRLVTRNRRIDLKHMQRIEAFRERLTAEKDCTIAAMAVSFDDDIKAYESTLEMLEEHPEINAFFIATSGGAHGVCQALVKKGRSDDITVVTFDIIPVIRSAMHSGIIDAAIYQHPRRQGQIAMQIAYDRLISCIEPTRNKYLMTNEIRILENL